MDISILNKTSNEYKKMEIVARFIELESENNIRCSVEDIYFDFGAGIKWTTIVANRGKNSSWQMLYPKHWDKIVNADLCDLHSIAVDIVWQQVDLIFNLGF